MRAVGSPKMTDQRIVRPVLAWSVEIAAIGPGSVGMSP